MNYDKELDKVKTKLFMLNKGLGVFLLVFFYQLKFKWCDDSHKALGGFKTAATDMKSLWWFKPFFEELQDNTQRLYVFAHELMHVYLQHPIRGRNKHNRNAWAYAVDIEVNNILDDMGLQRPTSAPPVFRPEFKGMVAEQIYDKLLEDSQTFLAVSGGEGELTPAMVFSGTEEQVSELKQKIEIASIQALEQSKQNGGNGIGALPNGMQSMLTPMLETSVDWKKYVLRWCTKYSGRFRSWGRFSRMPLKGLLLPAYLAKPSLGDMVFVWDVSGSMSDRAVKETIGQSQLIYRKFNPRKLTVMTFDTQLRSKFEVKNASDLNQVEITGRGGTVLSGVMQMASELKPSAIVVFSDMYVDIPEDPKVPVLFVAINNPHSRMPFGTTIHVNLK